MSKRPSIEPPGEEAMISEFLAPLTAGAPGARGLMDDCASFNPPPGMDLVLKTDPIRAGVHFFADDAPADIAWKALAVNVSDLAAKGAKPLVYLLGLSFPEYPGRAWMQGFSAGLAAAQAAFDCHLTGGDTDRAPGPISIAVTAIGAVPTGRMVPRTGAQPGDALFVTGTIGCAGLGLALLGASAPDWPLTATERAGLVGRYLRPEPRIGLRDALLTFATAAMDVSDGLAKDADRLCRASGVGGVLRLWDVPTSAAGRKLAAHDKALLERFTTSGDDYEILCTAREVDAPAFVAAAARAGIALTRIGDVHVGSGLTILGADGATVSFEQLGWDHFKREMPIPSPKG